MMGDVNTKHPAYEAMEKSWAKCRACAIGQKAVHAGGETYLHRLEGQTDKAYKAYRERACFFNAFFRTITGLKGMMFRTPPQTTQPDAFKVLTENVTASGVSLNTFVQKLAAEALEVGRAGILCEYPPRVEGATKADVVKLNQRPKMCLYVTESIINWRTSVVNNETVLSFLVLAENTLVPDAKGYKLKKQTRYRVLDLTDQGYRQRVFKVDDKGNEVQEGGDVFPTMKNKKMAFIPFYFVSAVDTSPTVYDPPLEDLANINISHYKTTADLEHGAHFTGLPTLVFTGYKPTKDEKITVGSETGVCLPNPEAKAFYLEFTGQGLATPQAMLVMKEQQMAILGARMLEVPKRAAEAAETASIHRQGEQSVLAALSAIISTSVTSALETMGLWSGINGEIKFEISTDFQPTGITPQLIKEIRETWLAGGMSKQAMFNSLKDGQLYGPEDQFEDEEARINEGKPNLVDGA